MTDEPNYRMQRIERLLKELEHEVARGMLEREVDETLGFRFVVPISNAIPNGVVMCEFRTRPMHASQAPYDALQPRLRVVK